MHAYMCPCVWDLSLCLDACLCHPALTCICQEAETATEKADPPAELMESSSTS